METNQRPDCILDGALGSFVSNCVWNWRHWSQSQNGLHFAIFPLAFLNSSDQRKKLPLLVWGSPSPTNIPLGPWQHAPALLLGLNCTSWQTRVMLGHYSWKSVWRYQLPQQASRRRSHSRWSWRWLHLLLGKLPSSSLSLERASSQISDWVRRRLLPFLLLGWVILFNS